MDTVSFYFSFQKVNYDGNTQNMALHQQLFIPAIVKQHSWQGWNNRSNNAKYQFL